MIRVHVRAFLIGGVVMLSFGATAKDQDPIPSLEPARARDLRVCEGFFTLRRPSALVIGTEERIDALIADGDLPDQAAVDRFDQDRFAAERTARARAFIKRPVFDGTRDIPPGLSLRVGQKILRTASPGEQPIRLVEILREASAADAAPRWIAGDDDGRWFNFTRDPRAGGRAWREIFHVRPARSIIPTEADYARLAGSVPATGLLVVDAGDAYTLIVYE